MTRDPGARGPLDPVVAGLSDGASAGYEAVELVVTALHEGLRRQGVHLPPPFGPAGGRRAGSWPRAARGARASRGAAGPPPHAPAAGPAFAGEPGHGHGHHGGHGGSGGHGHGGHGGHHHEHHDHHRAPVAPYDDPYALIELIYDYGGRYLVDLVMDLLGGALSAAGYVTRELLDLLEGDHDHRPSHDHEGPYEIRMRAFPGRRASGDFRIWNTGSTRMCDVEFAATGLVGRTSRIPHASVAFSPEKVHEIRPREHARVEVVVRVPRHTEPGRYRGIVRATVGGAWATVDLEVVAAVDP